MTRVLTQEQLRKLEQLRERLRESAETARGARIRALGLTGESAQGVGGLSRRPLRDPLPYCQMKSLPAEERGATPSSDPFFRRAPSSALIVKQYR